MLVLALLASLGMPIGAQNMDNKGRVSGDSVTVDEGLTGRSVVMNRLRQSLPFIMKNLIKGRQRISLTLFSDRD